MYGTRRIILLPSMPACNWAGLGSVGCGTYCVTWVNGYYAQELDVLFHELVRVYVVYVRIWLHGVLQA